MSSDSGQPDTLLPDAAQAGARWWSVDVHAHSPASFDFGGLEGRASTEPKPSFKEWFRAFIDAGLDGIVVADHNTHEGVDQARQALVDLRSEDPSIEFTIFPGVEMTAHGGTHVLAVLDPESDAESINRIITLSGFEGDRGRSDQTASKTVLDIASTVSANGGICVPAHADQPRGVFSLDPRDLDALGVSGLVKAVEVIDDAKLGVARRYGWIPVLGSDAHHLTTEGCPPGQDPKAPGTHFTRLKAGALNLEGLRLAITDPERSVLRCRVGDHDPNQVAHEHITCLTVRHSGAEQTYQFSPWMTCLIGGRGVGKSMILELLRLALGRSSELRGPVAEEVRRYSPSAELDERWWAEDSEVVVDYMKDGRPLRIRWSGRAPKSPALEHWDGNSWRAQSGAVADRAPIRVFSQKQVFELANSPQSLLAIVDDMPRIEKDGWNAEYEALQLKFKTERGRLRQLRSEADKSERIKGQLEEVRGRLAKLAAIQEAPEYAELTQTETRLGTLRSVEEKAAAAESELEAIATTLRGLVSDDLAVPEYTERARSFEAVATTVDSGKKALSEARETWDATGYEETWAQRVSALTEWVTQQVGGEDDASQQILRDRQREAALMSELESATSATERAQQLEEELGSILAEIRAKRDELFERRKAYVDALSTADATTQVRVFRQGQVDGLESELRGLLNRPDAFDSAFAKDGLARDLLTLNAMSPDYPVAVEQFKEQLVEFVEHGRDSAIGKWLKADNRFFTHVAGLDPYEIATGIMLWFPDDRLEVRYRPRPAATFEPVDRGSPGQRTAALLAVILQMGTEPLLLDQPEDDLENKLIKSLIVESLRRIKTDRQVVVATHNANIVVTSGAENIIVLEHGVLPRLEAAGTLQSRTVRDAVCLILEGGADAIRTRYQRLVDPDGR
jgi:hypothetical protein